MAKLFFICPDCFLEVPLKRIYGDETYFVTALGTAFDLTEFRFMEELNQIIINEDITEIILVNDHACTFAKSAVMNEIRFDTKAEKILLKISESDPDISSIQNPDLKRKQISKINLKRLAFELSESAFLGTKIESGELTLKAIIFNRIDGTVQETKVHY